MSFKTTLLIIVPILLCVSSLAQNQTRTREKTSEIPPEIGSLLNQARVAPAETKVDVLIRLSQSKKVANRSWSREILEEAFIGVREVKNLARMKVVPLKGTSVDTDAGYLSYAYDQKLDAYSLVGRVIKQMLVVDKPRARQMVMEINGRLSLKKVECKSLLVYDVSDIYGAVATVAKSAFTKKEIDEGVRALFLIPWFENIDSPTQVASTLDLLSGLQMSPIDRQILSTTLAKAMSKGFSDDRSFTFAVERQQIPAKMHKLVMGIDDPTKAELREAYKVFLLKNLSSSRCTDNEPEKDRLPGFLLASNSMFADKPIQYRDIASFETAGVPEVINYWRTPIAKKLNNEVRVLRTLEATKTDEWQIRVGQFLEDMSMWEPSNDETESEIFNQKCVLYGTLLRMAPEIVKIGVVRSYMRFLHSARMQRQNYIEWLLYVNRLATSERLLFEELISEFPNPQFRLASDLMKANL